jgi:lysozyme
LSTHQFDALSVFAFNVGIGAFRQSTLVRRLNSGDEDPNVVAAEEMPRWNKVRGKYVRGIFNRRVDTAQMFIHADYIVDWTGLEGQDG